MSKNSIVTHVTAETMAGDTPLEKAMNACITRAFIGTGHTPSDECLVEAKEIISKKMNLDEIRDYLKDRFGVHSSRSLNAGDEAAVQEVFKLLNATVGELVDPPA